jgi:hypothetical protein
MVALVVLVLQVQLQEHLFITLAAVLEVQQEAVTELMVVMAAVEILVLHTTQMGITELPTLAVVEVEQIFMRQFLGLVVMVVLA